MRSVDVVQSETLGIDTLSIAVEASRIWILPADVVPIIDVFAENNYLFSSDGLLI